MSSGGKYEYTDFEQLEQAEKQAGFQVKAKENFANGYSFKSVGVQESKDMDENDNVLATYKELSFAYEKDMERIYINTMRSENAHENDARIPDRRAKLSEIEVGYYVDTYKWVPTNYELTAEDKANMMREDYFISYGAEEVSETEVCYATWHQEGIRYSVMAYQEIPAEVFFAMAEELITSEN